MSKEYTYSMPESFMKDQSVPARWRILGIINGFSIAGKGCYASNEWFMKEMECSERTVSHGFQELEELGEIHCARTRRTRVAYRLKRETATELGLRPQPTTVSDRNQLPPISDSNSERELPSVSARPAFTIEDSPVSEEHSGDAKSPRVSQDKRKAYDELIRWSEKERGFPFLKTHITKQYKAFKIANENGITRNELMERWEELSTDKFWMKNGYDWMNVIESLNQKRS